ncbi:MAG TPA: hypothetical protein VMF61_14525 [Candidatus Acidoferrales bacterium]|nr:hypothetical protein [Candidatus Acidoferrales bacterium]
MRLTGLRLTALIFALGLVFGLACAGTAFAVQSHMVNARGDLNSALNQLDAAEADKAGHRANAIKLVQEAIQQVNLGISAGAR